MAQQYTIYASENNRVIYERGLKRNYSIGRHSNVDIINKGIILPTKRINGHDYGGVCDEELNFITGLCRVTANSNRPLEFGEIRDGYEIEKNKIEYCDETVIFGGVLIGHYGHMMVECLSRLWYHVKNPNLNNKIIFVVAGSGFKPYMYDYLDLLQINRERIVFISTPTMFKEVIVPEQSLYMGEGYTEDYPSIYRYMTNYVLNTEKNLDKYPKKVYLTKRFYTAGGDISYNEEYFEKFYESKGFKVVVIEKQSLREQVAMIANAENVATTAGTTALLMLFSLSGLKFDLLIKSGYVNISKSLYEIISFKDVNINFIEASMGYLPCTYMHGIHFIGPTKQWQDFVKEVYKDDLSRASLDDHIYENYIITWANLYLKDPNIYKRDNDGKDIFDIFKQVCNVYLNVDVKREDFTKQECIPDLLKQIEAKDKEIAQLKQSLETIKSKLSAIVDGAED